MSQNAVVNYCQPKILYPAKWSLKNLIRYIICSKLFLSFTSCHGSTLGELCIPVLLTSGCLGHLLWPVEIRRKQDCTCLGKHGVSSLPGSTN